MYTGKFATYSRNIDSGTYMIYKSIKYVSTDLILTENFPDYKINIFLFLQSNIYYIIFLAIYSI